VNPLIQEAPDDALLPNPLPDPDSRTTLASSTVDKTQVRGHVTALLIAVVVVATVW
jgi:hypothetical protein